MKAKLAWLYKHDEEDDWYFSSTPVDEWYYKYVKAIVYFEVEGE